MWGMNDSLQETAVQTALTTRWLGHHYYYRERVGSTNHVLKEMMETENLPAGTVLLTDYQSQGRGRLNRHWEAPPGSSLLMSMLFRPDWSVEKATWLAMITATAATSAIEAATGLTVALKWPNDVMVQVDTVWHKVSGLLLENMTAKDGRLKALIIGIGINVNIAAEALPVAHTPATSLLAATGKQVPRLPLLIDFWQRIEEGYETAVQGHSPQPAWQQRLITIGQQVQVSHYGSDKTIVGLAETSDEWGHLLVRDEQGQLHRVAAGDVTLRS